MAFSSLTFDSITKFLTWSDKIRAEFPYQFEPWRLALDCRIHKKEKELLALANVCFQEGGGFSDIAALYGFIWRIMGVPYAGDIVRVVVLNVPCENLLRGIPERSVSPSAALQIMFHDAMVARPDRGEVCRHIFGRTAGDILCGMYENGGPPFDRVERAVDRALFTFFENQFPYAGIPCLLEFTDPAAEDCLDWHFLDRLTPRDFAALCHAVYSEVLSPEFRAACEALAKSFEWAGPASEGRWVLVEGGPGADNALEVLRAAGTPEADEFLSWVLVVPEEHVESATDAYAQLVWDEWAKN